MVADGDVQRPVGGRDALAHAGQAAALADGTSDPPIVLGVKAGSPLLAGFSIIGLFGGQDMLRKRRDPVRLAADPRWGLKEHYSAMLGNGIATHVAFLAIGLPRLLPAIDGAALQYAAWFGPVAVAFIAKMVIDRRSMPAARLRAT